MGDRVCFFFLFIWSGFRLWGQKMLCVFVVIINFILKYDVYIEMCGLEYFREFSVYIKLDVGYILGVLLVVFRDFFQGQLLF